jgi:PAS domain S-box-containing protein
MKKQIKTKANILEELYASELSYRSLFESAKDGILILDAKNGKIVDVNPFLIDLLGYTKKEFIKKSVWEIGAFRDIFENKEKFLELQQKKYVRYDDLPLVTSDGRKIHVEFVSNVYLVKKKKVIQCNIRDITTNRNKENSLEKINRATSDTLNILLNHMYTPMIIWDKSMKIKRFNRQFELLSGYDSSEIIGKKIDVLLPKEKIAKTLELLKNHLDDEHKVNEIDILTKDNKIKTVLWDSSRILDDKGKNIIATISQDITSRKFTEDALSLSESRYRRLFESAQDGILILNADTGKIVDVNPFLIDLLGYTKNEFIEKFIWEIGSFHDMYENKERFLELQKEEYIRYDDLPLVTSDGREIHVEFVSNVYLENKVKVIQCNIRDTTIRRKSHMALRKSESHLRTLVNTIPDLIWLKDANGVYLSCNPMFERFFGANEDDIIGKTDYDFVDRELADFFCENDKKAMEAGKHTSNEEWVTFADDGHRALLETIKSPLYDSDGTLLGILGIGRDITERVLAGQIIQDSEKRFRAIFDQAPIAIALIDLNGSPIISNFRLSKMLGYTKDELSKMKFSDFTHPEDIEKDLNQFTELTDGKISWYNMEKRYIHKNGSLIWANLFVTALKDNNGLPHEIIGMVEDITEQKKILNEIKFQANLLNNVGQSVIATDLSGNVIYWNNAAEKIYGWSSAEAIGQNIINLTPAIQSNEQAMDIMKQLSEGKTWSGEFNVKRKDGDIFPAFVTDTPILDSNGKLAGIIGISSNITERKLDEAEMIAAKERAEESDRLKTAFLHNISHEIRTPMNAIVGFSDFLNDPDLTSEKRKDFTDIIIQSSDQLLAIIDDIIRIASIEAGQEKVQENDININTLCSLIYEQFSPKAKEKSIALTLKTDLSDNEAIIITDSTKLSQILTNLIGNALKFTQQGFINFGYLVKNNQLEFYVEDSGIGIPLNMQEIVFKRFRQVETTDTRNFGGSGLGLSISKAYVEMLGGKMWLTSELGKGTVFYFTIPYKNTTPNNPPDTLTVKDLNLKFHTTKTLLIAEDSDSSFDLLKEILSDKGIILIRAVNGIEAVNLCKYNPNIDLVLMDIKMPEMDGYEATTLIKEFKPYLPIIAQSAYISDTDRIKALQCGCSDFICKPINKKILLSKISEQLHK